MDKSLAISSSSTDTLHGRFKHQAKIRPKSIAVSFKGQHLSYEQIDTYATARSERLIAAGVQAGDVIALMLPRGIDLVVHILAVLKAGACYVPIDPNYPAERVEWVLKTSRPICFISHQQLCREMWGDQLPDSLHGRVYFADADQTIRVNRCKLADTDLPEQFSQRQSAPQKSNVAYVIFTSGSTGKPKGVMVGHQQVVSLLDGVIPLLRNDHTDVWTLFHSFAFDFSVWEIWGALTTGARLCIVPQEITWSAESFSQLLRDEQVSILNQTPSAFYALTSVERLTGKDSEQALSLRSVIFGGEALNLQKLSDWWECYPEGQPRLINMYGITETTVHVTWYELTQTACLSEYSPIGEALPSLDVYLLNRMLEPVAQGETGEMYIGGNQLAQGYLGRPDLTASRFIASPFHCGQRLYRSGDLAVRRDGKLFYLGRADRQLKIRGFRIEPAEIESAIETHPCVQHCAVLPKPNENDVAADGLIAFLVAKSGIDSPPNGPALRSYLANRLPAHLLPTDFVFAPVFPLTVNGKLDQTVLLQGWQEKQDNQNLRQRRLDLLRSRMAETINQNSNSENHTL